MPGGVCYGPALDPPRPEDPRVAQPSMSPDRDPSTADSPAKRHGKPAQGPGAPAVRAARGAPATFVLVAVALLVAILGVLPFWTARNFETVWDDPFLLDQLESVVGAGGALALVRSEFRLFADRPTGYYRPLTAWTLVRDARPGFGEAPSDQQQREAARRLHRTNLLLHAGCSVLVLLLLWALLGPGWPAVLGAALFAVHAVHVEPAVFVSARADSLACALALASTLAWLGARRAGESATRRRLLEVSGAVAALLGALAKETVLLLPVALVLWSLLLPQPGPLRRADWWRTHRGWLMAWLAAVVGALLLRVAVARVGLGTSAETSSDGGMASFVRLGLPALLLYLRLWIVAWPANAYYTAGQLAVGGFTLLAAALLAALTWFAARRGERRLIAAAWAFSLVFLGPVLHLVPLQGAAAAARFLYLPSVGLAMLVALGLRAAETAGAAPVARVLTAVALMANVGLGASAARTWRDNQTLFSRMIETSPHSPVAHHGLASVYAEQGLQLKAIKHYERTLELKPDHTRALNGLAVAHIQMKNYAEARDPLRKALQMRPDLPDAYTNMGIAYAMQDSYQVALPYFVTAARLTPRSPRARFNLGLALWKLDDPEGARSELEVLQRLDAAMAQRLRQEMSEDPAPPPAP